MPHPASDLELVRAAQSGQGHAFATLVQRTQGMARAIAYSATGDYDSAEDLAQEALVTAWTRLGDLEEPAKFRPWLAGIVRNCARYWRRHRGRHAPIAHEGLDVIEAMASADLTPLEEAEHKENWQRARAALRVLPSRYREPLILYYTLDESHAEVAGALGMTEAAVRQRLCRARKRLRDELGPAASSGKRLASSASAAAAVMLVIQSRQAWGAALAPAPGAALMSPKLFIGLGAATGGALIACTTALVLLLGSRDTTSAVAAERDRSGARTAISSKAVDEARDREPGPSSAHANKPALPGAGATVRIGTGKVDAERPQREQRVQSISPTSSLAASSLGTAPPSASAAPLADRASSGGRIRKHGPARLHVEAEEPGPRLRPSLSIADVQRELWLTE